MTSKPVWAYQQDHVSKRKRKIGRKGKERKKERGGRVSKGKKENVVEKAPVTFA